MSQKNFRVRNGLTIDGTTSGSSSFASTATGTDLTYVLPGAQGAASTVLTNDGTGNLSWALPGGGGSTFGNITVGVDTDNTISTTTGDLLLTTAAGGNIVLTTDTLPTTIVRNNSATNTNVRALILDAHSTGTPAVGLGTSLEFQVETAVSSPFRAGYTAVRSTDITAGKENFTMEWGLTAAGAAATQKLLLDSAGNLNPQGSILKNVFAVANTTASWTSTGSSISGTTLTIGTGTFTYPIAVGQEVRGNGVTSRTYITANISGSGAGSTWTVNNSQTVTSTAIDGFQIAFKTTQINGQNSNTNFAGNVIKGSIRNATTESLGDIWALNATGPVQPVRGVSIDNSDNTAKLPGYLARTYNSTGAFRSRLIFERARGTAASPTAVQSADFLGSIDASGCNGAGTWVNDTLSAAPGIFSFNAAENWSSNTNLGTTAQILLAPTATTISSGANLITVFATNPQSTTSRSDSFTFNQGKSGSNTILSVDSSGTLNFNNATTNSNYLNVSNQSGKITASISQKRSTGPNDFAVANFNTYKSADGVNYTPTLNGETLGSFKFNGNANTSTTPGVSGPPGASIVAKATENWTPTANGTIWTFNAVKNGTTTEVEVISISPSGLTFRADQADFTDSSSVYLTGNNIRYNRIYGQWQYDATITPAAANTAYAFPFQGTNAVTDYANIATATSTSRISPNRVGFFNLQFSVQLNNTDNGSDHTAYIWWRKNGVDITGSMGRVYVTKQHETIASWNNIVETTSGTDYFELMYAVDNVALVFPYFASTAFGPSTAAVFLSLTPVGA